MTKHCLYEIPLLTCLSHLASRSNQIITWWMLYRSQCLQKCTVLQKSPRPLKRAQLILSSQSTFHCLPINGFLLELCFCRLRLWNMFLYIFFSREQSGSNLLLFSAFLHATSNTGTNDEINCCVKFLSSTIWLLSCIYAFATSAYNRFETQTTCAMLIAILVVGHLNLPKLYPPYVFELVRRPDGYQIWQRVQYTAN